MKNKILIPIIIFVLVLIAGIVFYQYWWLPGGSQEMSCINSGGTVSKSLCCESVNDFPNTCLIGACGCPPKYSHEVRTCNCGADKCFNGRKCIQTSI